MAGSYFYNKISKVIKEDAIIEDFGKLLDNSISIGSFKSAEDLNQYLVEGAMLNVNSFGSKILSIPNGEYMVWLTDAGHTMLAPVADGQKTDEVFEDTGQSYEVFTKDLLKAFVGVSKTLTEAEDSENEEAKDDQEIKFSLAVDKSDIDRTAIMRAMEDMGYTETDLAAKVGVDTPAISRILRKPKAGPGDPGGRNPSISLAAQICKVLSMDPRAAFPDIFIAKKATRKRQGNRASGSGTLKSAKAFKDN